MRRYALFIILFTVFACFHSFSHGAAAQRTDRQADEEEAAREMGKHVYGKVIAVDMAAKAITVVSSFYEDEEMGVAHRYVAWSDTEFTNISSLSDIKEGDNVDIDYYIFEGERVIESIVKN